METIREDAEYIGATPNVRTNASEVQKKALSEEIRGLKSELTFLKQRGETAENKKEFNFPFFKWKWPMMQSKRKSKKEMVLVIFLNKKQEIETPVFVPVYAGNIIVYKNKAYEFDPRGIWRMRGVRGYPHVYLIREIDRRPLRNRDGTFLRNKVTGGIVFSRDAAVSNGDIEEVRLRGDSTESDEFLIKAALKAQVERSTRPVNWVMGAIVAIGLVIGAVWFFTSGALA